MGLRIGNQGQTDENGNRVLPSPSQIARAPVEQGSLFFQPQKKISSTKPTPVIQNFKSSYMYIIANLDTVTNGIYGTRSQTAT